MLIITLSIGCDFKSRKNTTKSLEDSLTVEELAIHIARRNIDSISNRREYYKNNLGSMLPDWGRVVEQNTLKLSTLPIMDKIYYTYSLLEYNTCVSAWNKHLREQGYQIPDAIIKEDSIRNKDIANQLIPCFTGMRSLFARACKEKYWIDDIDVKIYGNRNQYIHFIGTQFAKNKNIKEFHDDFGFTFYVLRFLQVRYSWYDGGEYTYFNIYDGKDNVPIPTILEGEYWWGAFPNTF